MGRTLRKWIMPAFIALAGMLAMTGGGADETPHSFVAVQFPRSGEISREQRDAAVSQLAAQQPDPEHIVVLIHGFDTPTFASAKQYAEVAPRVLSEFQKFGKRAVVLGVQWDSNVGPQRNWVPASLGHLAFRMIGLRKVIRDPYISRIPIARTLGRTGLRQVLFDVKDRFPNARIHVMAHSMGAEAIAHAINPEYTPIPEDTTVSTPERPLKLDVVALAGADLDFDSGAKSKPVNPQAAPNLLWVTLPKVGSKGDKILDLRKKVRSKAAVGNAVPAFREDQYDALIGTRRLVFDSRDIPESHALVEYWAEPRISRIAAAAEGIRDPEHNPSEILKACGAVLAAPAQVNAISPYLLGNETSPKVYALWRLEHLLCGSAKHMSTGYSEKVLAKTLKDPGWWDSERLSSDCKVVREGLWPPSDVVAASRKRKEKERATEEEASHVFFTQPVVPSLTQARQN